jgi:hypothetical protein
MVDKFEHENEPEDNTPSEKGSVVTKPVEWSTENEGLLVDWCDVAQSYKWLCMRSHAKYSKLHAWFTIPSIIMSTISGTASFAQSNLPESVKSYAPMVIGTVNITIGIMSTIQQYLKISELNEAYRVSYIAWDKYSRNLRIELTKHPDERIEAGIFLKHSREEFDRLMETSPLITDSVIREFREKFTTGKKSICSTFGCCKLKPISSDFKKPDICDTIISAKTTIYGANRRNENNAILENSIQLDNLRRETTDIIARQTSQLSETKGIMEKQQSKLLDIETELSVRNDLETQRITDNISKSKQLADITDKHNILINQYHNVIYKFISIFQKNNERYPTSDEIINNLDDEIPKDILLNFMETYTGDDDNDENDGELQFEINNIDNV